MTTFDDICNQIKQDQRRTDLLQKQVETLLSNIECYVSQDLARRIAALEDKFAPKTEFLEEGGAPATIGSQLRQQLESQNPADNKTFWYWEPDPQSGAYYWTIRDNVTDVVWISRSGKASKGYMSYIDGNENQIESHHLFYGPISEPPPIP